MQCCCGIMMSWCCLEIYDCFPHYSPFVNRIHRSPVDFTDNWPQYGALLLSLLLMEHYVEQTVELPMFETPCYQCHCNGFETHVGSCTLFNNLQNHLTLLLIRIILVTLAKQGTRMISIKACVWQLILFYALFTVFGIPLMSFIFLPYYYNFVDLPSLVVLRNNLGWFHISVDCVKKMYIWYYLRMLNLNIYMQYLYF